MSGIGGTTPVSVVIVGSRISVNIHPKRVNFGCELTEGILQQNHVWKVVNYSLYDNGFS